MRLYLQTPPDEQDLKYYQLVLQADLMDGWNLIRQWGWQGERGTMKKHHFDDYSEVLKAVTFWKEKQVKSGFIVVFRSGEEE